MNNFETYMICWEVADVASVVEVFLIFFLLVVLAAVAVEHAVGVDWQAVICIL